jgi:hypothetical protein
MKFRMSKIAAAIAAATMASSAGAVVVVGGNDGWEISFDGNVNAFYTHFNDDDLTTTTTVNGAATTVTTSGEDASRVHSGFLPAFFSFNVKTPTVNGLTGSARFSFAPTIQTAKGGNSVGTSGGLVGANIDTREVVANVEGSFGTVSFGRTLSIFGRQAILHDMTLFGVGNVGGNADFGSVTAGGIAHGYLYPDFQARFAYATPNINGFKAEVGAYDPQETAALSNTGSAFETNVPRFEGELSYATSFTNGTLMVWGDGMWQEVDQGNVAAATATDFDVWGVGGGAEVGYMGFTLTGYYQALSGTSLGLTKVTAPGTLAAPGNVTCGLINGATTADCDEADQDEWYVQGTYNFGQGTKVGFRYGEANQDGDDRLINAAGVDTALPHSEIELSMWSIGVYHDVNSWLKLIAEYNNQDAETQFTTVDASTATTTVVSTEDGWDAFSVGAFVTW